MAVDKEWSNDPLRVRSLIGTRSGDAERGPLIIMHPSDAAARLLNEGELAWVYGPRRHELAPVQIDPDLRRGDVILRDIIGASPSEIVRIVKPDFDKRGRRPTALG